MALVKVGLWVFFLIGFSATATTMDGLFKPSSLITEEPADAPTDDVKVFCKKCFCTKSIPPQCRCRDVGIRCHSACKKCYCTRSYPPQCHCNDINTSCNYHLSSVPANI
ncbi:hypothetical protein VNO78_15316 [Psophocarpus tetragonolobus]|uniref:Bowman-Birk serine protease inhibitors family domain-containing protein n=1 Tax=Psophocarpus tetragonolobus TaxID=3891 RepID=A0AAN9SET0_PSOTE